MSKKKNKEDKSTDYIPLLKKSIAEAKEHGYTKLSISKAGDISRPTVIAIMTEDTKLRLSSIIAFIGAVDNLNRSNGR